MISFPNVEWVQNSTSVNPSGARHLRTTGFIKELDTGAGGVLSFGQLNVTTSGAISDTKLVFAHVQSLGDASGVFNMKFFLSNISAWGAGTYRFLHDKNIHFIPNKTLNETHADIPTSIPTAQNLFSTINPGWPNGAPYISGILDQGVSQYLWLAVLARGDVSVGTYGGAGAGTFRASLLFDFS